MQRPRRRSAVDRLKLGEAVTTSYSWLWLVALIVYGAVTFSLQSGRPLLQDSGFIRRTLLKGSGLFGTRALEQVAAFAGREEKMDADVLPRWGTGSEEEMDADVSSADSAMGVGSEPNPGSAEEMEADVSFADSVMEEGSEPPIWPHPAHILGGSSLLMLRAPINFGFEGPKNVAPFMEKAFHRYRNIIFAHEQEQGPREFLSTGVADMQQVHHLTKLLVSVSSASEELQLETDESYLLIIPDNSTEAKLEATTIYGALRGLETLSQLCAYDFDLHSVVIRGAPWEVRDKPRFAHRGLLIDTSRHFLPVVSIKRVIRSLAYAKLNVLHWHMVDEQSFPVEIPSHPRLWDGAYSREERYTVADIRDIVEFAKDHGVRVMPEVDVPGHAASWGVGYPELWPSPECRSPLDISKDFTWTVIGGILDDYAKLFPYKLFHVGGDEVNLTCWAVTPHIQEWLQARNWTEYDGYAEFVIRVQQMALQRGWDPVNWEEPFNQFGERISNRSIVQYWFTIGTIPLAVDRGMRVIASGAHNWYLDHLDRPYESFYTNEPTEGISDQALHALVLGGEVCMWGETADASVIDQTIWPRAAAAAEVLWSPREITSRGPAAARSRYEFFRCLLNSRGIAAAPALNARARGPADGPGSCYRQRK